MNAKAGDRITPKAREALARAWRVPATRKTMEVIDKLVSPKAEGAAGRWFCITCGIFAQNNFDAASHARAHGKHAFAWFNGTTGKIEEP